MAPARGRGKRKIPEPPVPPQQGLKKWFTLAPKPCETEDRNQEGQVSVPEVALPTTAPEHATSQHDVGTDAEAYASLPPELEPPLSSKTVNTLHQDNLDQVVRSHRFSQGEPDWYNQYCNSYNDRLQKLRGPVLQQARSMWSGKVDSCCFLAAMVGCKRLTAGSQVVVVGIVFKDMKARPSLVCQYRDAEPLSRGVSMPSSVSDAPRSFCTSNDVLWLEDRSFRMQLVLPGDHKLALVTGLVIAVRGSLRNDGRFRVVGWCLAQVPPSLPLTCANGDFVAFTSGLHLGTDSTMQMECLTQLVDFLIAGNGVKRLIVCGGLFAPGLKPTDGLGASQALLERLLSAAISIDVMPGPRDPTNQSLPQMPVHLALLPGLQGCKHACPVTNPYECEFHGFRILGHSGQPVSDMLQCTQNKSPMEALVMSLNALHLAPTAPDTLTAQPIPQDDPFVMETVPHVLFSGGHAKADCMWWPSSQGVGPGTACVCVPAFHLQPAVVLVSSHNLKDARVKQFGN
mmetsp:Transcript_9702/g.18676  ORF Transcript_9702/g.18676 Transcript_9702/m.18676 type:complete len:513 (-) Transcript_9702:85-1623(-)|eukprot:CAMPEP_0172712084 /NCGR_PEP_ID=MMETSP1074-20121228/60893_1 /TAXON_ID=2916 /ORGANISM="Ceratium fusus, Strain PA161109" /LENGTH=512 /DNA_ID=CAMNT_0013535961 /DNA_START=71 /DNA_END=1609 /DNA_ORIENTATION=-